MGSRIEANPLKEALTFGAENRRRICVKKSCTCSVSRQKRKKEKDLIGTKEIK